LRSAYRVVAGKSEDSPL